MVKSFVFTFLSAILCCNLFGCASTNCSALHAQTPEYEECVAEENAKSEAASTLTKVGIAAASVSVIGLIVILVTSKN
ncbi:hypothetical protein [Fibrobacter sp.]|uniref:hypothetical protein n=1 Tax=Fibrobacter sp. TaxID=35828 RepID=UPI003865C0C3